MSTVSETDQSSCGSQQGDAVRSSHRLDYAMDCRRHVRQQRREQDRRPRERPKRSSKSRRRPEYEGSDGASSSSSRRSSRPPSSVRSSSSTANREEGSLAQALLQNTAALAANQALYAQMRAQLDIVIEENRVLTEANKANRATNAALVQRLRLVEQRELSTPVVHLSGRDDRLTPQASLSSELNRTDVSGHTPPYPPKRPQMSKLPNNPLEALQLKDSELLE